MILEQYWWPEQGTGRGTQCFDIPEIADLTQFRMGVDSKICSVTNDEILARGKVITLTENIKIYQILSHLHHSPIHLIVIMP